MSEAPLISVVTINRNGGAAVARTAASVQSQTWPRLQWVVVDGGSHDGSGELLRARCRAGDSYASGSDRGISDAFNKGVARCTGAAVLFLNGGDAFADDQALERLVTAWMGSGRRWITAGAAVHAADGRQLFTRSTGVASPWHLVRDGNRIFHVSTLVDRGLFAEYGPYREDFRLCMDYELWLRWMVAGHHPQVLCDAVSRFYLGGVSGSVRRRFAEEVRARRLHGLANPWFRDCRIGAVAWLKDVVPPRLRTPTLFRWKERLRW